MPTAEEFAQTVLQTYLGSCSKESEKISLLADLFRSVYALGQSAGQNDIKAQVSAILNPGLPDEDVRRHLMTIISAIPKRK
jgi:hypothetical protein